MSLFSKIDYAAHGWAALGNTRINFDRDTFKCILDGGRPDHPSPPSFIVYHLAVQISAPRGRSLGSSADTFSLRCHFDGRNLLIDQPMSRGGLASFGISGNPWKWVKAHSAKSVVETVLASQFLAGRM